MPALLAVIYRGQASLSRYRLLGWRWLSALPAAVFDALLVRLSRSTFEAAVAAFLLVFLFAMSLTSLPR
jgi:hypothetical protein